MQAQLFGLLVATGACVYLRKELFPKREAGK